MEACSMSVHSTDPEPAVHSTLSSEVSSDVASGSSVSTRDSGVSTSPKINVQHVLVQRIVQELANIMSTVQTINSNAHKPELNNLPQTHEIPQKMSSSPSYWPHNAYAHPMTYQFTDESPAPINTYGPFIRLITKGKGSILIHFGQLVGILDDRSGFLLQRVVSFDPKRVQLHILANLRPSDIYALTESKREGRRKEVHTSHCGSLLSQMITTITGLNENKRGTDSSDSDVFSPDKNPTTRHGPVLTTPGLVLIKAYQIRELRVISEDDLDSCLGNVFDSIPSASGIMSYSTADTNSTLGSQESKEDFPNVDATLVYDNGRHTVETPEESAHCETNEHNKTPTCPVNTPASTPVENMEKTVPPKRQGRRPNKQKYAKQSLGSSNETSEPVETTANEKAKDRDPEEQTSDKKPKSRRHKGKQRRTWDLLPCPHWASCAWQPEAVRPVYDSGVVSVHRDARRRRGRQYACSVKYIQVPVAQCSYSR